METLSSNPFVHFLVGMAIVLALGANILVWRLVAMGWPK